MPDLTYCSTFWELYDLYAEAMACNDEATAAEYAEKMREHQKDCKECPPPREIDK